MIPADDSRRRFPQIIHSDLLMHLDLLRFHGTVASDGNPAELLRERERCSFYGPSVYGPSVYGPSFYGPSVYGPRGRGSSNRVGVFTQSPVWRRRSLDFRL